MDFKPANVHVRNLRNVTEYGYTLSVAEPLRAYRYLDRARPSSAEILAQAEAGSDGLEFPKMTYWTIWGGYSRYEALKRLALPGGPPTHVLDVLLMPGTVIESPTWVGMLPVPFVFTLPHVERPGDGIEFRTIEKLNPRFFRVVRVYECPHD